MLNRKITMERFEMGAELLDEALEGVGEEQLDLSAAPGEWTIRTILHHLADDGDVWEMIAKKAAVNPGVQIHMEGFAENEAWAKALGFDRRAVGADLALFRAHRAALTALAEDLPEVWDNPVEIVTADGTGRFSITFGRVLEILSEHLDEHILTIRAILKN